MSEKHIFLKEERQTDAQGKAENRQIHCDFGTCQDFTVVSLFEFEKDGNSFRVVASTHK